MASLKRILIVYPVDFSDPSNRGVYDKMVGQSQGFEKQDYVVTQVYLKGGHCFLSYENTTTLYASSKNRKWSKFELFFRKLSSHLSEKTYDIVYIRHLLFTPALLSFLKSIKGSKIIYEFPTYPYALEWKTGIKRLVLLVDMIYRSRCETLSDLVVHYGGYDGMSKNIQITNGVLIPSPPKPKTQNRSVIQLVAVGKWATWHGLDRILKGLESTDRFHLKVIGEGPELANLKQIVSFLNLGNKVSFLPSHFGEQLSKVLWDADIGIGTLGLHRKGVEIDSSLKHRLYAAHGLPFVLSAEDADFEKELSFVHYVKSGDVSIDFEKVISWYSLLTENEAVQGDICSFAEERLRWGQRIESILKKL